MDRHDARRVRREFQYLRVTRSIEGLLQRAWIRAAFDRHDSGELEPIARRHTITMALDIARFGPDSTVLAILQGPCVRELVSWRGASITETVDRVIAHGGRHTIGYLRPVVRGNGPTADRRIHP